MVGSPEVMNTGEHKLFSKHENQELLIFSAQDLNTLAKGVPCLPSGLYETRMFHSSPQGGVYGVS
jgi:hypothetical protein